MAALVSSPLLGSAGIGGSWSWIIPLVLGFAAIYILLPRPRALPAVLGGLAAAFALLLAGAYLIRTGAVDKEMLLFAAFSGISVIAGANMVTHKDPVQSALSFVFVVLGTCGLFLLQGAPFLMAATIIVYAGAIIVTFTFVIMMAKQHGMSDADFRSREPFLASAASFFLLGAILYALPSDSQPGGVGVLDPLPAYRWGVSPYSQIRGATLDRTPALPAENTAYLGRALFTDYLVAVELGGTLLLVATIGSIVITSRRREGNR